MLSPITLRPYQDALIAAIYDRWKQNRRVLAQLPTGGGKTVLFAAIASQFVHAGYQVVVLAHREELILQAADKLAAIAGCPVGIIKAGYPPDLAAPVQVASVQSLVNRLHWVKSPGLVIVDEAHHATADSYQKILQAYPQAFLLGVTATPVRLDGSGFDDTFDALVAGPTVRELINAGHLSPFKLFADPSPMRTKGVRRRAGDFSAGDLARKNPVVELSGNLVKSYRQHCRGARCLVFAISVEHSRAIAQRYSEAGIPALHLDGKDSEGRRQAVLAAFKDGRLKVLTNCSLFDEGIDIPALEAVQIAKPTASLGRWLQMCGRALRPSEGKDCAIILDHTKNWAIHGLPTRPRVWSLEGVEQFAVEAHVLATGEVLEMPPQQPTLIEEDGSVLEAIAINEADEWSQVWQELLMQCRTRGYRVAWLYYKLVELKPPLELWRYYADLRGYHPGWAWHQFNQCLTADSA